MGAEKEDDILRHIWKGGRWTPGEAEWLRVGGETLRRLTECLGPRIALLLLTRRLEPREVLPYLEDPEDIALVRRLQSLTETAVWTPPSGPVEEATPAAPTISVASGPTLSSGDVSGFLPVTGASVPEAFPGLSRYVVLERLAQGGTATVFKARDTRLNRLVALKVLREDAGGQARRILREAQAQAKVEHENVCRVYEVGEADGLYYIAMQYIEGYTLDQVQQRLPLEQKVRLIRQVAEALHAAHRQGLIHRDVKPRNIMVELTEDGEWRPYVLDFGLAREVRPAETTLTHVIVGTPQYMAPEQARGEVERLDRRTDVYGLGATLYELLVGRPPFEGATPVEVLWRVLSEDPVPPRRLDPTIPADLETIVLKCLEKEPQRRYESARALAEDLGRYLDGEPIRARPTGWTYRLRKWVRRHRALVASAGVVLATVLLFLTLNVRTQVRARRQAALAQRLGQSVREVESIMQTAFLMPLHDVRREKALVTKWIREIESSFRDRDPIIRGPAAYALGRAYLVLRDYERARTFLQMAWDLGYREPEVAYALGLSLGHLYWQELEALQHVEDSALREVRRREIVERYRTPALEFLRQGRSARLASPEYVEALIAFYDRRYDAALAKVRTAAARSLWSYEERLLEAQVLHEQGLEAFERGRYEAAQTLYKQAESAYRWVAETARSLLEVYQGLCRLAVHQLELAVSTGRDPEPARARGHDSCRRALQVDPDDFYTYTRLAELYWRWAIYQYQRGSDPSLALEEGRKAAEAAIARRPDQPLGYEVLGDIYEVEGSFRWVLGQDPREVFEAAVQNYQKAVRLGPDALRYNSLGIMYGNLLQYELERGRSPSDLLARSVETLQKALRLRPDLYPAYGNLARAYRIWGEHEAYRGQDPTPTLDQAIQHYRQFLRGNPRAITGHFGLGKTYQVLAAYRMATCQAPEEALHASVAAFQEALRLDPRYPYALWELGRTLLLQARHEMMYRRQDPRPSIHRALDVLQQAQDVVPRWAEPYYLQGQAYLLLALDAQGRGRSPADLLRRAAETAQRALRVHPTGLLGRLTWAEVRLAQAEWDFRQGRSPIPSLSEIRTALQGISETYGHDFRIPRALGQAALLEGRWLVRTGRSPDGAWAEALGYFEEALRRNPSDADAYRQMAEVYRHIAAFQAARRRDPAEALRSGEAAVGRALTLCPNHPEARALQQVLRRMREQLYRGPGGPRGASR